MTRIPNGVPKQITAWADGFTVAGRVLNRGDLLDIDEQVYESTVDRNGDSVLAFDERRQVERYRRVMFVPGDRSKDIRKADAEADARAKAARKAAADRNGLSALADAWEEEDALRAAPNVFASQTTAGDRMNR